MSESENPLLTPEDRVALANLPRRVRAGRVAAAVRDHSRLRPWMQLFAYWYAFAPKPTVVEQRIRASEFACDQVSTPQINNLKRREDFRELVEKFQAGGVEGALAKLKADLPFYVDLHRKGAEMAYEAKDYAAIPKFTLHALEITSPRRNDLLQQNLQVNIQLSPKQLALEDADAIAVTAEPIAPDPV